MWRYDLHIHTNHSAGVPTPVRDIIKLAERLGMAGIAITDHDTMDGAFEALSVKTSLEIIPGCEITLDDRSHVIGLYLKEMVKSKRRDDVIAEIRAQEGLVMIPHPFRKKAGLLANGDSANVDLWPEIMRQADLMEIYNSGCSVSENQQAEILAREYRSEVKPTASSDAHLIWRVGTGQLCVQNFREELSQQARRPLRELLQLDETTCGIYIGDLQNALSTSDLRPPFVRLKQWLKPRFPVLNVIREGTRSMIRSVRVRPE